MSIFSAFNRASHGLFRLLGGPAGSYCRLETADDPFSLVADDGSLIGAFAVLGTLSAPGDRPPALAGVLAEKTRVLLERPGHSIQLVFEYDPGGAAPEVAENLRPARATAEASGLALGRVIDGWSETLSGRCGAESLTAVLWTRPSLLPELERRRAARETLSGLPPLVGGSQTEGRAMAALRGGHHGAMEALGRAFSAAGLSAVALGAHDLVRRIQAGLCPSLAPPGARPLLPGDPRPLLFPEAGADPLAAALLPSLAGQIFPGEARIVDRSLVLVGQRLHAPFLMALPPRSPRPFAELFRALSAARPGDPLRMCLSLTPDGLGGLGLRGALARILGFSSGGNRALSSALAALRRLSEGGETIVGLSMAFDTFADLGDHAGPEEAQKALRRRLARLAREISGWGQGRVQEVWGDPLLGLCASLPALMPHGGPAPRAAAPLSAAWSFLPVRPASPWASGPLVLRTPDGKIMPFAPSSSVQSAWIDLGLAPMGGGKSVLLNTLNLAFCLQGGLARLPWVSIIDVGPSSSGLISLLRNALPPRLRHLAVHHRLKLDPSQAVNPFDTPAGPEGAPAVAPLVPGQLPVPPGHAPGPGRPALRGRGDPAAGRAGRLRRALGQAQADRPRGRPRPPGPGPLAGLPTGRPLQLVGAGGLPLPAGPAPRGRPGPE
ncbi:MAG: hypothetical protein LBL95_06075, partial [Deltaproteobacteria bacterium]|nr:hypothetical protein [Deltaproteobacteria bacterium]